MCHGALLPRSDRKEDGKDGNPPGTADISSRSSSSSDSQSDSWPMPGNQTVSAPSSAPPTSSGKAVDDVVNTTSNSNFPGLSISNNTFESGQVEFGLNSTPWQATDSKAPIPPPQGSNKPVASVASLLRPPPGLGTENALPESPLFDDEPPSWLKSLIDSGFSNDKTQSEFQFSRFGFANSSAPWSPLDAGTAPFSPPTPTPQPWAAVGGPAPTLSSSGPAVSMAPSENVPKCQHRLRRRATKPSELGNHLVDKSTHPKCRRKVNRESTCSIRSPGVNIQCGGSCQKFFKFHVYLVGASQSITKGRWSPCLFMSNYSEGALN